MTTIYEQRGVTLSAIRNGVEAVDRRFYRAGAKTTHRITAVLIAYLACFARYGRVTAEDVQEAWEELADIKRVVRGDYVLEPDEDTWWVGQLPAPT